MVTPGLRRTAAAPALTPFIGRDGRLSIRRTGKTLRGDVGDMGREPLRLLCLGCGIGLGFLVSQLGRMHHDKPDLLPGNALVGILHFDIAADTPSTPASWGVACGPA